MDVAPSHANSAGWIKWKDAPNPRAITTISPLSVVTITSSICLLPNPASIVHAISGFPQKRLMFFLESSSKHSVQK